MSRISTHPTFCLSSRRSGVLHIPVLRLNAQVFIQEGLETDLHSPFPDGQRRTAMQFRSFAPCNLHHTFGQLRSSAFFKKPVMFTSCLCTGCCADTISQLPSMFPAPGWGRDVCHVWSLSCQTLHNGQRFAARRRLPGRGIYSGFLDRAPGYSGTSISGIVRLLPPG